MQYTNRRKYPKPIFDALTYDDYDSVGDFSVTTLLGPPRISQLIKRHDKNIVQDCIKNFYKCRGNGLHKVVEDAKSEGSIKEFRFCIKVMGKMISMKPDCLFPRKMDPPDVDPVDDGWHLLDNKDSQIFIYKMGEDPKWTQQTNLYAYGLRCPEKYGVSVLPNGKIKYIPLDPEKYTFDVNRISIALFLKDYKYLEAKVIKRQGYPEDEVEMLDVPVWSDQRALDLLKERINVHMSAENLPDDDLPECSLDDRFGTKDVFAVVLKSSGNAARGGKALKSEAAAKAFQKARYEKNPKKEGDTEIEFRKGDDTKRCERYCAAKAFCSQFKKLSNQENPFD